MGIQRGLPPYSEVVFWEASGDDASGGPPKIWRSGEVDPIAEPAAISTGVEGITLNFRAAGCRFEHGNPRGDVFDVHSLGDCSITYSAPGCAEKPLREHPAVILTLKGVYWQDLGRI
jgi:hypothetical protein